MTQDINRSNSPIKPDPDSLWRSEPSGYLLHNGSLLVLSGILLFSAWAGLFTLVLPLSLILGAALLAKIWTRLSLIHVFCERNLKVHRLFPGDQTELTLQVVNRKPLPLPWVEIEDEIPRELVDENIRTPSGCSLTRASSLLWYRRAKWKFLLQAKKRGYYRLGPMRLRSGDLFGFYTRTIEFPVFEHIIVYPTIFSINRLSIPSLFPFGDIRSPKRIFQDPARPMGLRDYQSCDPLRHIHWKVSARCQKLQTKVFEPTTTLQMSLFLAVDSFQAKGAFDEAGFERGISIAASIAHHFMEKGIPIGLFVNTQRIDSGHSIRIIPGGSREQILVILEALAKVTSNPSESFEIFLQKERKNIFQGNTLVFVVNRVSEDLSGQIRELKEIGYKLQVLSVGEVEAARLDKTIAQCWIGSSPTSSFFQPRSAP